MIIDAHAHYVSPNVVAAVQSGTFGAALQWEDSGRFRFPQTRSRPFFSKMTDLEQRLARMDELGVDVQVLSTWVDVFGYDLPEATAIAFHRAVNEGLANAVARHPDRFRFVASVPLPYGDAAAIVLEEAVGKLGAVGVMIGTNIHGRNLDNEEFEPLWRQANSLSVPVILHPYNVAAAPRLQEYYLENLLGNPFDTTIAATCLIFGGVLDRYSGLQVLLLHGGGYFPFAVGRLDHGFRVRPETKTISRPPSSYLSRFHYDVIVYQPELLAMVAERVGVENVMLGSDYPFDMEPSNAVSLAVSGIEESRRVLEDNPARFFSMVDDSL